ncbi:hypothetical protein ACKQC9_00375 [Klebsiella michiganensis]|uniref:hypothetical protein n=1 Tax=Klebsiella TaxID=570 RepID=UPI00141CEF3E|nr:MULTISPECIES: hypothetical protein [Klebsiella]MBS6909414.1 hypothetical protein [Klebsiella sp.]MDM4109753.1 hypothetical protein [Klebsiella michiganensis]MDM4342457.1 hypothetical protein [Klebsiella michiganensis]MDM4348972.1 hypothetical protein [Klebsiella michiganensis]MEE1964955.1 hypothetical protein [Klebsiella michiganensis]
MKKFSTRLEEADYEALVKLAKVEGRSLNQTITQLIRQEAARREQLHVPEHKSCKK